MHFVTCVHIRRRIRTHRHMRTHVHAHADAQTRMHARSQTRTHACTHICTHVHTQCSSVNVAQTHFVQYSVAGDPAMPHHGDFFAGAHALLNVISLLVHLDCNHFTALQITVWVIWLRFTTDACLLNAPLHSLSMSRLSWLGLVQRPGGESRLANEHDTSFQSGTHMKHNLLHMDGHYARLVASDWDFGRIARTRL